ncbi:MAG: ATP-dependent DNA helicase [Micrococcaceae bacterium]
MHNAPRLVPATKTHRSLSLSPSQEELVALPSMPSLQLMLGGAATGKTAVLKYRALELAKKGVGFEQSLVIASSRSTGARLRNELSELTVHDEALPAVKSWQAVAFEIVSQARAEDVIPDVSSKIRLLSGAEQDALLAEMLKAYEDQDSLHLQWPVEYQAAQNTFALRKNIRDFFDMCAESALGPEQIAAFAHQEHNQLFVVLAQIFRDYLNVVSLRFPEAYAPAELLRTAIEVLKTNEKLRADRVQHYQNILIDDLQDASYAHLELLEQLLSAQSNILIASNPEVTVQGFRGARPQSFTKLQEMAHHAKLSYTETNLKTVFGFNEDIAKIYDALNEQLPAFGKGERRYNKQYVKAGSSHVALFQTDSELDEEDIVVDQLSIVHVEHNVPWEECAIIANNHHQLQRFEQVLRQKDIPVVVKVAELPLKEEQAVQPLLDIYALTPLLNFNPKEDYNVTELAETVENFLRNIYISMSSVEVRKLRQQLRINARAQQNHDSSDSLLLQALSQQELLEGLSETILAKFSLFKAMLKEADTVQHNSNYSVEEALWKVWEVSKKADLWKDQALNLSPESKVADHNLDAVVALFTLAARFSERQQAASINNFITHVRSQEVVEDLLASQSLALKGVNLLTPAGAVGQEFSCVLVPGLQEGAWPQKRLIADIFETQKFIEKINDEPVTLLSAQLKEQYFQELRAFLCAISRAKDYLILTAVSSEEQQVSAFFMQAAQIAEHQVIHGTPSVDQKYSVDSIIVQLRKILENPESSQQKKQEAAKFLALISQDEAGARLENWWGVKDFSSTAPFYDEGEEIRVSPSRLDQVHRCPLCWMVSTVGGTASTDYARSLGTLVHAIAEAYPDASAEQLREALLQRWKELGVGTSWADVKEQERVLKMMDFVAEYMKSMHQNKRTLVVSEKPFSVKVGKVILHGTMDRLEQDSTGKLMAVDYKTGKARISKDEAKAHVQMRGYQLAIDRGAFKEHGTQSAGAILVGLGTTNKSVALPQQDPLTSKELEEVAALVEEAAELMSHSTFEARHNPAENTFGREPCDVPQVCPLCLGKQVTEL